MSTSNSQKPSYLEMPLLIGTMQIKNSNKNILKLDTQNFSIHTNISNDKSFKSFLKQKTIQGPIVCNYEIVNEKILHISQQKIVDLLDFTIGSQNQDQRGQFPIYKRQKDQSKPQNSFKFGFKIEVQVSEDRKLCNFFIQKQNLAFSLVKISSNVKFVKNILLLETLEPQSSQSKGLLTMDQSNRLLFMEENMKFPVIGFWIKSQKSLNSLQIYDCLSQFVKNKYNKKCLFKLNGNKQRYFYFVKVAQKDNKIETFLVSWNQNPNIKKCFEVEKMSKVIDLRWQNGIQAKRLLNPQSSGPTMKSMSQQSGEHSKNFSNGKEQENGMDFTLRQSQTNKTESLQSLINYSYLSPIKQLQQKKNSQNLFSEDCQNSPQFSTLCKQTQSQNQFLQLKTKVKEQQTEIKKLRQIISIMQSELKLYKNSRMSTNCQSSTKNNKFSQQIDSPNSFPFTASQREKSNGLSPEDIRRLRQSDLNSNSFSKSDWLKNSINQRSNRSKSSNLSNSKGMNELNSNPLNLQEVILDLFQQPQKILNCNYLPQINEEDARDPWQYMEIIQD